MAVVHVYIYTLCAENPWTVLRWILYCSGHADQSFTKVSCSLRQEGGKAAATRLGVDLRGGRNDIVTTNYVSLQAMRGPK